MYSRELRRAELFRLMELVEFKPEILAGWEALTCDLRLADASLNAREGSSQAAPGAVYPCAFGVRKTGPAQRKCELGRDHLQAGFVAVMGGHLPVPGKKISPASQWAQMWFYFSRLRPREYEPVSVEADGSATDLF